MQNVSQSVSDLTWLYANMKMEQGRVSIGTTFLLKLLLQAVVL